MKKTYYSFPFILFLFLLKNTYSQVPDWSWVSSIDAAAYEIKPYTTTIDSFGNMFVAGSFEDADLTFGNTTLDGVSGSGYESPFLVKYNFIGEVVWAVEPSSQSNNTGSFADYEDMAIDQSGNIYLIGRYKSKNLSFGSYTLSGTQTGSTYYENAFIVKYDAGGNVAWALSMGGSYNDSGYGIAVDEQDNVYCVGSFASQILKVQHIENGAVTQDTLTNKNTSTSKRDIFLVKYNPEGELAWATSIGDSANTQLATGMALANNGIYIVGSWSASTGTTISLGSAAVTCNGYSDALLIKTDLNGTIEWAKSYGGSTNDYAYRVEANADAVFCGGRFGSSSIQIGNTTLTNQGGDDIFFSKISSSGNEIWTTSLYSADDDFLQGMSIQDNKWIYLTGYYMDETLFADTINLPNKGERDAFYAKYDSSGNVIWAIGYGDSLVENGYDITNDENGNVYIIGNYMSKQLVIGNDTLTNSGSNTDYNLLLAALVDYSDTVSIIDTTTVYEFDNGGLYGGTSADLTYSLMNNRLFAGIETPASLFFSDDNGTNWNQAFSNDSLEYTQDGSLRGWSGKAEKILCNSEGWVAVQTTHPENKYSSIVISYNNGDTNTWKTVVDQYLLENWGYAEFSATAIGLSDYFLYGALGPYICKADTSAVDASDITDIRTLINGVSSNSTVNSIAVANTSNGYPFFIAVDTSGNVDGFNRLLYKFDGINFSQLSIPINGIRSVFTHPFQTSGDTIFICGRDINNFDYKIYRSFDGGLNWTDISYTSATNYASDVDYSPNWNLSSSNNSILIVPGNAISKDLGNSWEIISDTSYKANAIHPFDINTVVASAKTVEVSTSGVSGSFTPTPNYGLEALPINDIARTLNETVFYIATQTGLGYTTAYLDTSVSSGEKWSAPYGAFPLISDTIAFGSVAINPNDSLHVIAGCPYGFYVSTTGANGFSLITPSGFSTDNPQVNDIVFVNSYTAIAVTGGDSAYDAGKGNIWRTQDGGLNWANVSPSGFSSGNAIAIGMLNGDTILYIGTGLLNADTGYLWKSEDIGQTWLSVKNGPTSMAGTSVLGLPINDVEVDPRGKDTLYIAAGYDDEYAFVASFDGGETFVYLNSYAEKPYTSIAINLEYPDTVYTASGREIYLYDLANNNFRFVFRGLPDEQIPALMTGSILVGTTTGFYTFDPHLESDEEDSIPTFISALSNELLVEIYPNPFTEETNIAVSLIENTNVSIALYDIVGNKIKDVFIGNGLIGKSTYSLSSENLSVGIYCLLVKANDTTVNCLVSHLK